MGPSRGRGRQSAAHREPGVLGSGFGFYLLLFKDSVIRCSLFIRKTTSQGQGRPLTGTQNNAPEQGPTTELRRGEPWR